MSHCTKVFLLTRDIFFVTNGIVLASTIPMIYKYVKSWLIFRKDPTLSKRKLIYYCGLLFIVFTILALLLLLFIAIFSCTDETIWGTIELACLICHYVQSYFLLLLSNIRIYFVFKGSAMSLSKCYVRSRIIIFSILAGIIIIFAVIIFLLELSSIIAILAKICFFLIFLLVIILSIMTLILFIRKLIQVYRHLASNETFIAIITQLSILTLISVSITMVIVFLFLIVDDPVFNWRFWYLILFDVGSNFWCIMLTFEEMNHWYMNICGCFDSKCRKLWTNIVTTQHEKVLKDIAAANSISVGTKIETTAK